MNKSFVKKLGLFLFCGLLYLAILCASLWILYSYTPKNVIFYTPYAIFSGALISVAIWYIFQKDLFETVLVYCCYVTAGFAFIFLAPYAVDRSLSTFIFFYAVEHEGFPADKVSAQYMQDFYERRLSDSLTGNFLEQDGSTYRPKARARIYYHIMYPIGKMTNSLKNYQAFVKEVGN